MTTKKLYQLPVDITQWHFDGATEILFNWEYDDGSSDLLNLYEKGKKQQWDASSRIDWSQDLFEDNPMGLADESIPITAHRSGKSPRKRKIGCASTSNATRSASSCMASRAL